MALLRVGLLSVGWPGRSEVGGAARYGFRLACGLSGLVDLTVITSAGGTPVPGARMHFIASRSSNRFLHYYGFPLAARREVDWSQFDVVHAFGDDWALPRMDALRVRTFHGSSMGEARSSKGLRKYNHFLLSALEHRVKRTANVRLGVGADSVAEFDCHDLTPPVADVRWTKKVEKTARPTAAFVGSFGGRKRGWMALSAVQSVRDRGQTCDLVVVGPESGRSDWPSWVDYRAGLTDTELLSTVAQSWVLLAPSEYEGFGIPAFESLQVGTPVIATNTPGFELQRYMLGAASSSYLRIVGEGVFQTELLDLLGRDLPLVASDSAELSMRIAEMVYKGSAEYLADVIYQRGHV